MTKKASPNIGYVYVLTRRDIPQLHLSVQVGHAAIAATNTFGNPRVTHPNLVVCALDNEEQLEGAFNRLKESGIPCCAWYEEDMDNRMTAIATGIIHGADRKHFRKFKLLN